MFKVKTWHICSKLNELSYDLINYLKLIYLSKENEFDSFPFQWILQLSLNVYFLCSCATKKKQHSDLLP